MMQGWHVHRAKTHFGLTPGQWHIVKAICNGADTRRKLEKTCHLSKSTIGKHVSAIHESLGSKSIAGIVLRVLSDDVARAECFPELRKHDTTTSQM